MSNLMFNKMLKLMVQEGIKVCNLDFDDTLARTENLSHIAALEVFQQDYPKVDFPPLEVWSEYLTGKRVNEHLNQILHLIQNHKLDVTIPAEFSARRDDYQEKMFAGLSPLTGVVEFIQQLKLAGIKTTIVSNSRKKPLMTKLAATGLHGFFAEEDIYHPENVDESSDAYKHLLDVAGKRNIPVTILLKSKEGMLIMSAFNNNVAIGKTCLLDDTLGGINSAILVGALPIAFIGAKPNKEQEVLKTKMLEMIPQNQIFDSYV
jgi:FMN phosphatase YigB (HAD superfamily)